jgi:uncharacterized protein (DUF1015 family)
MAALAPFRALRPAPSAAARVAAVPYDVVNADEARTLADGNPLSFLHVSRAEIDCPRDIDPHSDAVYGKAVDNFDRLKHEAPLVVEDAPSIYVYRLQMGDVTQTGIAACYSLDEYDHDVIKKHERTRPDKEDDRTRHLIALRAQTGPVFLIHRTEAAIDRVVDQVVATQAPLYDFTAPDEVRHTVWRVDAPLQRPLIDAFSAVPTLYIADGHHRAASAARARRQLRAGGAHAGEWDTFLAVAFPASQVRILPYNRLVTDLGDRTPDAFLEAVRQRFTVQEGAPVPVRGGDVSMFLNGKWHTITLGQAGAGEATDRLDVSRLQDLILNPLLGIRDPRSSTRIEFVGGLRGTGELERAVQSGRAAVAFSLYPVSVHDLMTIADDGGIMPPKSTWFEPKLRDGLLSHVI